MPAAPSNDPAVSVLRYIRGQLTPEGLEARGPDNQNVQHLIETAAQRVRDLRPYLIKEDEDQ